MEQDDKTDFQAGIPNGFHTDSIITGACAISRKGADNKKALKSHDFKAFYMVEISGIEPLTS